MTTAKIRRIQAENETPVETTFKAPFRDTEFVVHRDPMDWGFMAMDHLNDSKLGLALEAILGPVQYSKLKALHPSTREAAELLNVIAENAGAGDSGN